MAKIPFSSNAGDSSWIDWLDWLDQKQAAIRIKPGTKEPKHPDWEGGRMATGPDLSQHLAEGHQIAIRPGSLGCIVIDIDAPKSSDNPPLEDAIAFIEKVLGPPIVQYETKNGGRHYWYQIGDLTEDGRGNGFMFLDGKHFGETRCDKGYAVVWDVERLHGGLALCWDQGTPVDQTALDLIVPPEDHKKVVPINNGKALTPATATPGHRDTTLNRHMWFDIGAAKTKGEVAHVILKNLWDALVNNPDPLPVKQALRTVRSSVKKRFGNQADLTEDIELDDLMTGDVEPITWLWHQFIPKGEITVLAGRGGTGKSTLAMTLAAIVASGGRWPDGSPAKKRRIVIASTEDAIKKVQKPRYRAAMAAMGRSNYLKGETVKWKKGDSIATALPRLMDKLEAYDDPPGLLVIDPLIEIMRRGNSNAATDVRQCLHPLQTFATETGMAILGITHLTKYSSEAEAVERVLGSSAWTAKPRMVLLAHHDKSETESTRKLLRTKSNLGPNDGGFKYELEQDAESRLIVQFGDALTGDADTETKPNKGLSQEDLDHADQHVLDLRQLYHDGQRPDWGLFPATAFNAAIQWHPRDVKKYRELRGYESKRAEKPHSGYWWREKEDADHVST